MHRLATVFAQKLNSEIMNEYWKVLSWVPDKRFIDAVDHAIEYHRYVNIPRPAEMREFVRVVGAGSVPLLPAPEDVRMTDAERGEYDWKWLFVKYNLSQGVFHESESDWRRDLAKFRESVTMGLIDRRSIETPKWMKGIA